MLIVLDSLFQWFICCHWSLWNDNILQLCLMFGSFSFGMEPSSNILLWCHTRQLQRISLFCWLDCIVSRFSYARTCIKSVLSKAENAIIKFLFIAIYRKIILGKLPSLRVIQLNLHLRCSDALLSAQALVKDSF